MESEKVKEIKKVLECCANWNGQASCNDCPIGVAKCFENENLMPQLALTLINELESENERGKKELKRYKMDWLNSEKMHLQADMEDTEFELFCANKSLVEVRAENKQLKDQIAELEKEIEENAFYSKGYAQGIKNTYEVVVPDKLKQFGERLKEITCEMYLKEQLHHCIDEILKECIDE